MTPAQLAGRGAAVLGAIAMVVGALAIRGDDTRSATGGDRTVVLCPTDLRAACAEGVGDAAALITEEAGTTADRLIDADGDEAFDADVWIVPAAWAEAVIDERVRLGKDPRYAISAPLATSPAMLAIWTSRDDELAASCTVVDWSCLADRSGQPLASGDRVTTGIPDIDSGVGLPLAGAQTADLLDTNDFASNDFAAITTAASRLAGGQTADPLGAMRTQGPGRLTAVAVVQALAPNLTSNFGPITLRPSEPRVDVDLVAMTRIGADIPGSLQGSLADAFVAAGWDTGADDNDDGLPAGGVLAAVRSLWNER